MGWMLVYEGNWVSGRLGKLLLHLKVLYKYLEGPATGL